MLLLEILFWVSSYLIIYSYVLYPMFLIVYDLLFKRCEFEQSDDLPGVTVLIAAYNEEKVIKSRLENCLSIDYPAEKIEILIASDGSDDQTNEIVASYKDKGISLVAYEERRGKVNVLNETVPKTKHSIVVFSDANTMFKRDAIKKLVRHFADERIGSVCGGLHFVNPDGSKTGDLEGVYWRYENFLKKMEGRRGALLGANGAIYALRKELYEPAPEDTIVEDFFIPMKILQRGYSTIYDPEANAIEETAHKIIHEKQRRIRIGAGDFQALFRLIPMLNPFRGFSAVAFWSHKALRWFAPFFLIIAFVSNLLLVLNGSYLVIFLLQCAFYIVAIIGQMLSFSGKNIKMFNLSYYFVSMNIALLLGFFRYITSTQNVAWNRTER